MAVDGQNVDEFSEPFTGQRLQLNDFITSLKIAFAEVRVNRPVFEFSLEDVAMLSCDEIVLSGNGIQERPITFSLVLNDPGTLVYGSWSRHRHHL